MNVRRHEGAGRIEGLERERGHAIRFLVLGVTEDIPHSGGRTFAGGRDAGREFDV
jgi:hypothetical protein